MKTFPVKIVQVLKFVNVFDIEAKTEEEAIDEAGSIDPILSIADGDEMERIEVLNGTDSGLMCIEEGELVPKWAKETDWQLLLKQQEQIVEAIEDLKTDAKYNAEKIEALDGILNWIGSIRDWAADELEIPNVFQEEE